MCIAANFLSFGLQVILSLGAHMPPASAGAAAAPVAAAADDHGVKRWEPIKRQLVPAPKVKPGLVYSHWNEQLGRRVWAVAVAEDRFLYALGPGSTWPVSEIDLPYDEAQRDRYIAERDPMWARQSEIRGTDFYATLDDRNEWTLVRWPTIRSLYDLETSRRWEWHGVRPVAVLHTGGELWEYAAGKYLPLSTWPTTAACGW